MSGASGISQRRCTLIYVLKEMTAPGSPAARGRPVGGSYNARSPRSARGMREGRRFVRSTGEAHHHEPRSS